MQNDYPFRRFIIKNSYLLIIAAWFITISFIIDNYLSGNSSVAAVRNNIENYIQKQEKDFEKLMQDTALIKKINDNRFDEDQLKQLIEKKYVFYRYFVNDIGLHQLIFWNTQTVLPSNELLSSFNNSGFIELENGFYAWKVSSPGSISVALIPVKWNYFVTNTYLRNSFAIGKDLENNYDISTQPDNPSVQSIDGNRLFYLSEKPNSVIQKSNQAAVCFRILAVICILLFIHLLATFTAAKYRLLAAILFLVPVIFGLRLASYFFPFPLNFRQLETRIF